MSLSVRPRGRPGERRDLPDLPPRAWRPAGRPALPGSVMLCFLLVGVRRPAGAKSLDTRGVSAGKAVPPNDLSLFAVS